MRTAILLLVSIVAAAALAIPTTAATRANTLTAVVGPGFNISMSKKTVPAGTYVIVVHDESSIHNFHFYGPGVNKTTSVAAIGTSHWTVKLKKGTYNFVCDPHAAIMHGVLKVT
jgi:plastocyanin